MSSDRNIKKAASNFLKNCVSDLKTSEPGKAAATLKRMGAQPGDCEEGGSFTLLNHIQENLSVDEQLERLTEYFVSISQEFPPSKNRTALRIYPSKTVKYLQRRYSKYS